MIGVVAEVCERDVVAIAAGPVDALTVSGLEPDQEVTPWLEDSSEFATPREAGHLPTARHQRLG